jgi:hypothetical protein
MMEARLVHQLTAFADAEHLFEAPADLSWHAA